MLTSEAGGLLDPKHDNKSHFPWLTAEIRRRMCVHLELGFEPVSSPWNIFVEVMVVEVWSVQVSPRQLRQCANWTASEFPCFARAQYKSRVRNLTPPNSHTEESHWSTANLLTDRVRSV